MKKMGRLARWGAAAAAMGAFVLAGAQLAGSATLQAPQDPPGMWGPQGHGPGKSRRGRRGGFMPWRLMRQLELTDQQKEQLRALRKQHMEQTQAEREALQEARKAFGEAVRALEEGTGDESIVRKAAEDLANAQADLAIARSGLRQEMLSILTPEQKEKLKELRAQFEERRQQRIERRRQRRQNPPHDGSL